MLQSCQRRKGMLSTVLRQRLSRPHDSTVQSGYETYTKGILKTYWSHTTKTYQRSTKGISNRYQRTFFRVHPEMGFSAILGANLRSKTSENLWKIDEAHPGNSVPRPCCSAVNGEKACCQLYSGNAEVGVTIPLYNRNEKLRATERASINPFCGTCICMRRFAYSTHCTARSE